MAKKLLTDAAATKLARQQEEGSETLRILPRWKAEKLPKSFRLGTVDIERARRLSERLGEAAGRLQKQRPSRACCCLARKPIPKNCWHW